MVIGWEMPYPMKAAFIQRTVLVGLSLAWLVVAPPAGAANPLIPATQAEPPAGKPIELPKDLTQEQVRDLMSRLSDTDVRQMLIAELDMQTQRETEESAAFAAGRFFQRFQDEGERIRSVAAKMAAAIPDLPAVPSLIWAGVTAGGHSQRLAHHRRDRHFLVGRRACRMGLSARKCASRITKSSKHT